MRSLLSLAALVAWALASPAALAEPCRDMDRATGSTEAGVVGAFSAGASGTCCTADSGCGVCCLAPSPYAPEPFSAGPMVSVAAAVLVVVLRQPTAGLPEHGATGEARFPRSPDRLGASGPRGPPAC